MSSVKKCQFCGAKATMFLTQIVKNEVTELTLCERCAKERGLFDPQTLTFAEKFFPSMIQEKVADLIQQLSSKGRKESASEPNTDVITRCPVCDFPIGDYYTTDRLGCPHCYQVFTEDFTPELRKALATAPSDAEETPAGEPAADGNAPVVSRRDLELELKRAIAQENYELAATLRDRIQALS